MGNGQGLEDEKEIVTSGLRERVGHVPISTISVAMAAGRPTVKAMAECCASPVRERVAVRSSWEVSTWK
jgi:hypothetical protein